MSTPGINTQQMVTFNCLYEACLGDSIDLNEFGFDDLYAFQVLQRATESPNLELRNMAAHLDARRRAGMESVTLQDTDYLTQTWRLSTPARFGPPPILNIQPEGRQPAGRRAEDRREGGGIENRRAGRIEDRREGGGEERRSSDRRIIDGLFSPEQLLVVGRFKRLYDAYAGKPLDIGLFARDDTYGRGVLHEAVNSGNPPLIEMAGHFFDQHGQPKRHRRNRDGAAPPAAN